VRGRCELQKVSVQERVCDVLLQGVRAYGWSLIIIPTVVVGGYVARASLSPQHRLAAAAPPGQVVDRIQEVECDSPVGWPVVLVRDVAAGAEWWVQEPCRAIRGTRFVTRSHFGNEKTPSGTRYQLVVLAMRDANEASRFTVGSRFTELPSEAACSEPIELVRQ
jgi:hypothetical protein